MKKNCSALTIKLLAIIAMTVDHIAVVFVPQNSMLYYFMRLFGRLTAPIMAFFIAEGFRHTRSRKKYLLRLAVFGLISQPFYFGVFFGKLPDSPQNFIGNWNVMVSLAIALLTLIVLESGMPETPRLILVAVCISLGHFSDWSLLIPVWTVIFYIFRNDFRKMVIFFAVASVVLQTIFFAKCYGSFLIFTYHYGTLFALIPLWKYNGERGSVRHKKLQRWFFYVYYPAHMVIMLAIQVLHQ